MGGPVLGIDLGGSKLLGCVLGEDGQVLARARRPTGRGTGPDEAVRLIGEVAREFREAGHAFDAAGVGFPGLADHRRGVARSSVMLDGWREVPLARLVGEALGVPCRVDNDVNAAALAELRQRGGVAGGMVMVGIGTGIGGAVVIDGRLVRGASGVAGEIGNTSIDRAGPRCWCGRRGCLNTLASGSAIEEQMGLPPGGLPAWLAAGGDPGAPAIRAAAAALGHGLGNVLNLLNPELVVLAGGVAQLGEGFLRAVAEATRVECFAEAAADCSFEFARAGYEAGAIGAALLALGAG